MDYQITMVTLGQAVASGSSTARYIPWSANKYPFTLANPTLSTITIRDDDQVLNSRSYSPNETEQYLTTATTFGHGAGAQTVPAGTKISNFLASLIRDGQGNEFRALFPRDFSGPHGEELGGRHSVLILPQPKPDPVTGQPVYPTFDPTETFRFVRQITPTSGDGNAPTYPPPAAAPCFVAGTLIDTMFGPRAIETLAAGDMIRTRDNGMRWLSWVGSVRIGAAQLDLQPNLRPVRIRAGALADGVPARDLTVSPQHRILLRSATARRLFGEDEILVAAKHLIGLPGIEAICPAGGVTYWHMLFDGHEVVLSDGAWSESLFTGPQAMKVLGPAAQREILALFPHLSDPSFRPAGARRMLTGREGRQLAGRHARTSRQLVEES
ncbi:Hint domain-containing protein [Paracoccus stylophorae]|nr:Hint domain-containing protein [Paracoccus stylophorae]